MMMGLVASFVMIWVLAKIMICSHGGSRQMGCCTIVMNVNVSMRFVYRFCGNEAVNIEVEWWSWTLELELAYANT